MAHSRIVSEIAGKVWKIETAAGARVAAEETVVILESMKMEIPVVTPGEGVIVELLVAEGDMIDEGQPVAIIEF